MKDNIREVPLFGLANSSMRYSNFNSNIEYDFGETDFEKATECINPHILSFPAANPCYFDWTTGWSYSGEQIVDYINNTLDIYYDIDENLFDENETGIDEHYIEGIQTNGEYFFQISNRAYDWWKNTDGDWEPINIDINDFSDFIFSNNIESTFWLNMLTSDIHTTLNMINDNINTVSFKRIELGSEYYLRGGGDTWIDEDPRNYKYDEGEELIKDKDATQ